MGSCGWGATCSTSSSPASRSRATRSSRPTSRSIATTEVAGYTIRLEVEGPPDDVDTTLTSSDPSLTQGDLASLLTTGRTAESAPEAATGLLEAQAATYLGELFKEQLGLGLVFDTPASLPILSSESGAESRFTVGRRITDELTVAYSVATEDANSQLWILDYQPLRRLWFRAIEESGEAYTFEVAQRLTSIRARRKARAEPQRIASVEVVAAEPARAAAGADWTTAHQARTALRLLARGGRGGGRAPPARGARPSGRAGRGRRGRAEPKTAARSRLRFVVDPGPPVRFSGRGTIPARSSQARIESQWGSQLPPGLHGGRPRRARPQRAQRRRLVHGAACSAR